MTGLFCTAALSIQYDEIGQSEPFSGNPSVIGLECADGLFHATRDAVGEAEIAEVHGGMTSG